MREADIGDVIVLDNDTICGVVTDRDIVVRVLAEDREPAGTKLGEICSRDLATASPDDDLERDPTPLSARSARRRPTTDGRGEASAGWATPDRCGAPAGEDALLHDA